jgi:HSP20 family protein
MALRRLFPEVQRDMQRILRAFEDPFFHQPRLGNLFPSSIFDNASRSPAVFMHETPKDYVIEAELPGVKKDNIDIQCVDDRTLVLQGNYSGSSKVSEDTNSQQLIESKPAEGELIKKGQKDEDSISDLPAWQGERWRGNFHQAFTFPTPVNPDSIQASYKDGLLSITVPKMLKKSVQIKLGSTSE